MRTHVESRDCWCGPLVDRGTLFHLERAPDRTTAVDLSDAPEVAFRNRIQRFEDGEAAPESLRERVARELGSESVGVELVTDDEWDFYLRPDEQEDFYRLADRAIAVMRGTGGK